MGVVSAAEAAVSKVFHEIEAEVEKVDGAALAEAKTLLADAKEAEGKAVALASQYKTEIEGLISAVAPEVKTEIMTALEKMLADFSGLFGA